MSIYVDAHGEHLTHLDIELIETILTEYIEHTFLGELFDSLDDERTGFPGRTCTLTHTAALRQHVDDFSLNLHYLIRYKK